MKRWILAAAFLVPACGAPATVEQNDPNLQNDPSPQPEQLGTASEELLGNGWCGHATGQLLVADFNGDHRDDLLCNDTSNGSKWIAYADTNGAFNYGDTWSSAMGGWCGGNRLHLGDFNGDGRTDFLCHSYAGENWIALADDQGHFGSTDASRPAKGKSWHMPFLYCSGGNDSVAGDIALGEFNSDGHTDILCHRWPDGYTWIAYAEGDGGFNETAVWHDALGWCGELQYGEYGYWTTLDQIIPGQLHSTFPLLPKNDLLCHNPATGRVWQLYNQLNYVNFYPFFSPSDGGDLQQNWCGWNYGEYMKTGDFDGDGMMDLICRRSSDGYLWIAQPPFGPGYAMTDWHGPMNGWCTHPGGDWKIGDFNGDGHDDLMCYTRPGYPGAGEKWITRSKEIYPGGWGFQPGAPTDWHHF